MNADNRRLTAEEHVREAMHAEMREYERQLATAFVMRDRDPLDLPDDRPLIPPLVYSPTPAPIGVSFADLGVLLIVAAACGMMIGAAIVSWWLQ